MLYRVDSRLFDQHPQFFRGVVVATGVDNTAAQNTSLERRLRDRVKEIELDESVTLDIQRIQAWRDIYATFPLKDARRIQPSIAALVRRIKGGGKAIPFISPLVCISNLVSLLHLVPSGLIDAARTSGDLVLGYADGSEAFQAIGSDELVSPVLGEIIYFDSETHQVMCRAWNSRGGKATLIQPNTTSAIIDIDGLLDVIPQSEIERATNEVASLVEEHCGAKVSVHYLSKDNPFLDLSLSPQGAPSEGPGPEPTIAATFLAAQRRSDELELDLNANPNRHRVLTGDRPTGSLHIGHEFGSIANRVRLQNLGIESFIVIADYQVLTDRQETQEISTNVRSIILDYLSLGLDPWDHKTYIFTHSQIPELHQLVLPFSMLVTCSELERNPTMKEEIKASRIKAPSVGMFIYPVSQAADILFCKATVVPVGKDQLPHLELTRKIAARCNERYGKEIFPQPEALLSSAPLSLGLDGGQKMSKSRANAIFLTMTADEVDHAIKRAKTDSSTNIAFEPSSRPEISNLVQIYSLCSGLAIAEVVNSFESRGYAEFKKSLTDVVNAHLEPIRRKRSELEKDKLVIREALSKGNEEARKRASETLNDLRSAMQMSIEQYVG
jgi:tryptophanyl-tRNA synthetase